MYQKMHYSSIAQWQSTRLLTVGLLVRAQLGEFSKKTVDKIRTVWYTKYKLRLLGQAVKTSPFHGGNTGSIPVGVTKKKLNFS